MWEDNVVWETSYFCPSAQWSNVLTFVVFEKLISFVDEVQTAETFYFLSYAKLDDVLLVEMQNCVDLFVEIQNWMDLLVEL